MNAELQSISKSFGEVQANNDVNLKIRSGTIHALVGENGAGKSTAMKMLFGLIRPDSGIIKINDKEVFKNGIGKWSPHRALEAHVGMVHQHFMLAGPETVLDNLVLGVEETRLGFRNRKLERLKLETLMSETGLKVPLDEKIQNLPIGLQSRCEILKVLYRHARFLILDEPTAVLTPVEIEEFLKTLRVLRERGHTVLIVTHKLKEVMAVSDEITILRSGKTIARKLAAETSDQELSELMVGRRLVMPKATAPNNRAGVRLTIGDVAIRAGEITGIAGVEGNGQEELASQVLKQVEKNEIPLSFIPADRHKEGLVLSFTLTENLRLTSRYRTQNGYFSDTTVAEKNSLKTYDVRPNDPSIPAFALSGGNQQKLIVARELAEVTKENIVLAIHPTRGVDLGAIEFIHGKLLEAASRGAAVLLISSEMDELLSLSHRIGAIHKGKIVSWFDGPGFDEMKIGYAMLGGETEARK